MHLRKILSAAALVATVMMGCSGRDDSTPDSGPDNGCTGACNQNDGGTDGGTDGGARVCPAADSQGRGRIGALRATGKRGDVVNLDHLVITTIDNATKGSQGDYIAYLWVVDP